VVLDNGAALIPSKEFDVWSRLYNRFSLEPHPAGVGPSVSKTIVPVTQADLLLAQPQGRTAVANLTAASGTYVAMHTVPKGERWHVTHVLRGGTDSVTSIHVLGLEPSPGTLLALTADGTAPERLTVSFILDEGDSMGLLTTGGAGDTARNLTILYSKEESF